jgi:hypothetical protein
MCVKFKLFNVSIVEGINNNKKNGGNHENQTI